MRKGSNTVVALAIAVALFSAEGGMRTGRAEAAPTADPTAALTVETAAQLSQNANRPVIVIMKNRVAGADAGNDQASLMDELNRVNARRIKSFRAVNAMAATVSDGEVERLKANPAVAQVAPDVLIHRARHSNATAAPGASLANAATSLTPNVIPGACGPNGRVLLSPEALKVTHTDSDDPSALTARSLGFTGAGVKLAYIADGVDPKNINFIRKDGTSAFIEAKDFTGDGPGQVTSGDEAFLDSNAIAGQGIVVYDVNHFGAQSDPAACNIRIEGMAPGASLIGLNVFGTYEDTTESNFLEAIDYAIASHVDVLNESFGSNQFPDVTSLDVTKMFNEAAVQAGITVTASSGDAGSTNTIGSPATDPKVIGVGASTAFQFYAQTNYAAARYFASSGWLNDNISSLSSGGFSETGATISLVAPGDLGFASCDASPTYQGCTNFLGQSSDVEESGGTSQSAPLTAGAAALVIEAFRKAHHGASPAPALVKQILTSTATDLGVPATEQGAGLLNSYKAVLLAQSIDADGAYRRLSAVGQTLLLSQNRLTAVGRPGTSNSWPVSVTNTGTLPQFVQIHGRTFGAAQNVQSGSVVLKDGTSPQFANYQGLQNNYAVINFNVPGGADRLNASIAYPANPANGNNARIRLILIDPQGRLAAHSLPQGVGNFGNVDVREPSPGRWTGVIFGDVAASAGTNGTVPWQVSTQRFVAFGRTSPSRLLLSPGESQTIDVSVSNPSVPGDSSGSIVLTSSGAGFDKDVGIESNSIPVTLRSLVDAHGGAFNGVLTGGNGRPDGGGQVAYYEFDVAPGHRDITANVSLTNDLGDAVGAYLVAPDGAALGFGQNLNSLTGAPGLALTAYTLDPVPGRWTLVVDFPGPVVGDEISQQFTGNIKLDTVHAQASGLPDNEQTRLPAGVAVIVPVTITNHGAAPEQFFIDARLKATTSLPLTLGLFAPANPYALPLTAAEPTWVVPTHTSSVQAAASGTLPIEFDYGAAQGDPDLYGAPTTANHAAGSYTPGGGTVQPGLWYAAPTEIGPYSGPAAAGSVSMLLTATTQAFDPAVTSPGGDFWLSSFDPTTFAGFTPVTINPGQSASIDVTITPAGSPGSVVSGYLYVDDYVAGLPPYGVYTGDELVAIPYKYTVQ